MSTFQTIQIDTERLTLRQLSIDDAADLLAVFSDPEVTRYWSTPPWTSLEEAEQSIQESIASYAGHDNLRLAIALKDSNRLIGTISLYRIQAGNRRADIGYALARAHWRRGYLSEAMPAFLTYGFEVLNLNRVEADIDPRNAASGQLLEKMAFLREGTMRERWIVNGEVCDTAFYGLIRSDWNKRAGAAP